MYKEFFLTKKAFTLFIILLLSGCGQVQRTLFAPSEIEDYCQRIFGNSNGSDEEVNICIQQERDAKDRLSKMTVPVDVGKRCRKLSETTGGSYQVLLTCVQKEMPKKPGK